MEKEREGGVKRNFVRRERDSKAVFTQKCKSGHKVSQRGG